MRERPIPFSAPMVRALLAGTKTQTRRAVKLPHMNPLGTWEPGTMGGPTMRTRKGETVPEHPVLGHSRTGDCIGPKWCPGDQLWVREAWRAPIENDHLPPREIPKTTRLTYEVDPEFMSFPEGKKRPPMFMCRWMSRITLEVTGLRVERLHEISDADAMAEGIQAMRCPDCHLAAFGLPGWGHDELNPTAQGAYRFLWESINGAGSWDLNPYVWAIEFRRLTP